jgi:eukaryotic-like serine/threonine-protein kinase
VQTGRSPWARYFWRSTRCVRCSAKEGGHAWVYECFDRFLKRKVAVKVIKTLREAGRDLSQRAQSEAQVLAALAHPNLVRVIDAGLVAGLVYIVMEKLEGQTLRHALIATSRLSVREALQLAIQIADGMELSHSRGVIHRDLKPENIFIEGGNHVKVLDFGIAKVLGASHVTTQRDKLQGTVFYMSPEQLQGLSATPASDVFALGTMVFEMLYGHPLLLGGSELPNNEHVAWMQLYKVPPPLESLDPSIPRYVGKLVGRAIVKLPADRYQTMREFRDAAASALRRYETERARGPALPAVQRVPARAARPVVAPQSIAWGFVLGMAVVGLVFWTSIRRAGEQSSAAMLLPLSPKQNVASEGAAIGQHEVETAAVLVTPLSSHVAPARSQHASVTPSAPKMSPVKSDLPQPAASAPTPPPTAKPTLASRARESIF